MNNKGFSLVEVIIVVAIMSILVGVAAPILIGYFEKTNVSADVQLCDSVKEAVSIAMVDPDVICATDTSADQIAYLTAGNVYSIEDFTDITVFTDTICEIVGKDVVGHGANDLVATRELMKSRSAKDDGILKLQMNGGQLYVWIDQSDLNGKNANNTSTDYTTVASSGVIYAN